MDYTTLTDEELNDAVLALKGWEYIPPEPRGRQYAEWGYKHNGEFTDEMGQPPDYLDDMNAAWELAEEMREHWTISIFNNGPAWRCDVDDGTWEGRASTAPRAICLAWLAWKRAQNPG